MDPVNPRKLRVNSRRFLLLLVCIGPAALLPAAPAVAYVPSAVNQYTEQPPKGPGGPGAPVGRDGLDQGSPGGGRSRGAGGGGSVPGGDGTGSTGGEERGGNGTGGFGDGNGTGGSASNGNGGKGGGGALGVARGEDDGVPAARTLPIGGYPTNTLLWIALGALVLAAAFRAGMVLREKLSGSAAH